MSVTYSWNRLNANCESGANLAILGTKWKEFIGSILAMDYHNVGIVALVFLYSKNISRYRQTQRHIWVHQTNLINT